MLLREDNHMLLVLLNVQRALDLFGAVDGRSCGHVDQFDVGLCEAEASLEGEFLDVEHLGIVILVGEVLLEVAYVLYLAGLCHSVALLLESASAIKLHYLFIVIEYPHKQEKTTNYCSRPPLTVITVEHSHSLRISRQKVRHLVANDKQSVERWSFMVFPLETDHIAQH